MYATAQDMLDRFGTPRLVQLTDINLPQTGLVNAVVLDKALGDASVEIDGYLVGRMALPLPLASVPGILRLHCCTIAHYRLLGPKASETDREDYKTVLAYLTKVASGSITLQAPADIPAVAGVGPVLFDPGTKVMGRDL